MAFNNTVLSAETKRRIEPVSIDRSWSTKVTQKYSLMRQLVEGMDFTHIRMANHITTYREITGLFHGMFMYKNSKSRINYVYKDFIFNFYLYRDQAWIKNKLNSLNRYINSREAFFNFMEDVKNWTPLPDVPERVFHNQRHSNIVLSNEKKEIYREIYKIDLEAWNDFKNTNIIQNASYADIFYSVVGDLAPYRRMKNTIISWGTPVNSTRLYSSASSSNTSNPSVAASSNPSAAVGNNSSAAASSNTNNLQVPGNHTFSNISGSINSNFALSKRLNNIETVVFSRISNLENQVSTFLNKLDTLINLQVSTNSNYKNQQTNSVPNSAANPVPKPAVNTINNPAANPVSNSAVTPAANNSVPKPAVNTINNPAANPVSNSAVTPAANPISNPDAKPAANPATNPVSKPVNNSVPNPANKPAANPVSNPVPKLINNSAVKPTTAPVNNQATTPIPSPTTTPIDNPVPNLVRKFLDLNQAAAVLFSNFRYRMFSRDQVRNILKVNPDLVLNRLCELDIITSLASKIHYRFNLKSVNGSKPKYIKFEILNVVFEILSKITSEFTAEKAFLELTVESRPSMNDWQQYFEDLLKDGYFVEIPTKGKDKYFRMSNNK